LHKAFNLLIILLNPHTASHCIQRYQSHPDCKYLLCFVYDPEGWISNPRGLENDLNREGDELVVKVIIVPKGGY